MARGTAIVLCAMLASGGCRESADARPARTEVAAAATREAPWLVDITEQAGLRFTHHCGFDGSYHLAEIMGPGCGLLDYDNDGDLDVLLIDGGGAPRLASDAGRITSRLWRQEAGGNFVDVTESAGLSNNGYGMGCAVGDIDNDGHLDVYLTNYGPNRLFHNQGDGTFRDVTEAAGVAAGGWSVSAAFLDYDRDGRLDLYVVRYLADADTTRCTDGAGRPEYCGPASMPPVADVLYRNIDGRRFEDVSSGSGIAAAPRRGLGVAAADFDGDGWQDVYVANDGDPNQLWINRGDGTFVDKGYVLGAAVNAAGQPEGSMGIAVGDVDGDRCLDLLITNLRGETNTLYRRLSPMGFEDVTARSGLGPPSLPFTGFGTGFVDFDHDGLLDVLVVQGRVTRGERLPGCTLAPPFDAYGEPGAVLRGLGGARFAPIGEGGQGFCERIEIGRGAAFGDIDNDGDIDVLVSNCEGPARLYRNDAPKHGHWLMVRAVDLRLRRDAIGAAVSVTAGGRTWIDVVTAGSSYASSSDARVHFGLGETARVDRIEVTWPDGLRQSEEGGAADRLVVVERREGPA